MQRSYYALYEEEADDHPPLKEEILACCWLSSTQAAANFHHWAYQPSKEPLVQMDVLLHATRRWFQPDQVSLSEIVEHFTLNKFLRAPGKFLSFPGEERKAVGMKAAKTPRDMVTALECTLSTLEIRRGQEPPQDHARPQELRCSLQSTKKDAGTATTQVSTCRQAHAH